MKATLLIIDDEKHTREGLQAVLEEEFDVYVAASGKEARRVLQAEKVELLLTDLKLGSENGISLMEEFLQAAAPPTTIIMTAYGSVDLAVEAMKKGAYDFITKPINIERLEFLLRRALRDRRRSKQERRVEQAGEKLPEELPHHPTTTKTSPSSRNSKEQQHHKNSKRELLTTKIPLMIGTSEPMQSIFETIEQVAPSKATILIQGESGTGKEVAAKAIHALSPRAKQAFIAVHCAALSPQLLESELFGHEKGAFTGATERRIGRFEEAKGGTLFLDEIGEIDPSVQVKILRVLGEHTFERVGSNQPIKTDIRLIAATNRRLEYMVAQGSFREDLYFRLNVVPITMPPLRERPQDIPLLIEALRTQIAKEHHKPNRPFSQEAMALLCSYHWPGNVRELRTAIEHAIVLGKADEQGALQKGDLPRSILEPTKFPLLTAPSLQEKGLLTPTNNWNHLNNHTGAPGAATTTFPPHHLLPPNNPHHFDSTLSSTPHTTFGSTFSSTFTSRATSAFPSSLDKESLEQALAQAGGNRTKAASLLGISRRTFYRKLAEFQVE